MADIMLPRTFQSTSAGMRPNLLRALQMTVETGDAATAANLFAAVAGRKAAAGLGPRDVLEKAGAWLSNQNELANQVMDA